ncbi:MAG: 50S ribosomal protein L25/general stress protein Ctc [Bacteroidales bacterium]|jgi:large subunit ribosomal protein L25|nr:50S ribosomal protein L25/general stress protein Ctc [Bacteroidales bacterium]MDX9799426.1 50S ribosomal protein L25/general stress protein Ctc [Bacteroidales bacterium]
MKTVSMSGSPRENVGKKDAKSLRRQGLVPCVMYGGEEQVRFSVPATEFKPLLFTPDTNYIELNIEGKKTLTILQDIQYHPVSDEVIHADFLRLFDDKPITISVPVKTVGVAPGVLQGGKLETKIRKMKLKGLPNDMPQYVEVNISNLNIAQGIKVEEIQIPNIEKLDVKSSVVVWVKSTRQAAAAANQ